MEQTQETTQTCSNCYKTNFESEILKNEGRCSNCDTLFPFDYKYEIVRKWLAEYGHRLKIIEDLFAGKSFKPIHDAMELHVEEFHKRIIAVENFIGQNYKMDMMKVKNIIETAWKMLSESNLRKLHSLPYYNEFLSSLEDFKDKMRFPRQDQDSLSPEAFGVLLKRIEKLEAAHQPIDEDEEYNDKHEAQENAHEFITLRSSQESNEALCDLNNRLNIIERNFSSFVEHMGTRSVDYENYQKKISKKIERTGDTLDDRLGRVESLLNDYFNELDERIEKLEEYMEMEDRVTASTVLLRLTALENSTPTAQGVNILTTGMENLNKRMSELEDRCGHNNSIVCKDLNKLEHKFDEVCKNYDANRVIVHREPFKCPVCEGTRNCHNSGLSWQCETCQGKGIVWG